MSKPKWTPGPWQFQRWHDKHGSRAVVVSQDPACGYRVADCDDYHASEEENEANARLIAAAPELLVAAERLLSMIDPYVFEVEWAWALISRAKGGAPR